MGWAKNLTVNSGRKIVAVEFNSVAGLEIGDPVAIRGVRKGYVEDIIIKKDHVNVIANLDQDVILKEDSKFSIMMLDLMGGKKVEVDPGTSENELDYNALQHGKLLGDIASAMAVLGNVQQDLVDVIKEVKTSLGYINNTFADEKFVGDLKSTVKNFTALAQNLNTVLLANKDEINDLLNSGNKLTNNVNSFIEDYRDSLGVTLTSLKSTLEQSKVMINKINSFMDKIENGENNLGKMMKDEDLMNDLKTSVKNLKDLSKILLDQLQKNGVKVDAHINLF